MQNAKNLYWRLAIDVELQTSSYTTNSKVSLVVNALVLPPDKATWHLSCEAVVRLLQNSSFACL